MIKYLGSKRALLDEITCLMSLFPELSSVTDLFSGTSRCGHAFKKLGRQVFSNDHNTYAHTLAQCYVAADRELIEKDAIRLIDELNALPGSPGYFTETFCREARFFQPFNGERVDAIRNELDRRSLSPELRAVLLTSLMEAADRVDSTCGIQMAYVKQWAKRSFNPLKMRMPNVLPSVSAGPCYAFQLEALEAARQITSDIAYLDPPYNQHSYLSNYHIWETLIRWDQPEAYGVARKRVDCRERKSLFNTKRGCHEALKDVIREVQAKLLVVSFNNEGFIDRPTMEALLSTRGEVLVWEHAFRRYIGSQIGIHNPKGERVGGVSHTQNKEYLYVVLTEELLDMIPDARQRLESLI